MLFHDEGNIWNIVISQFRDALSFYMLTDTTEET